MICTAGFTVLAFVMAKNVFLLNNVSLPSAVGKLILSDRVIVNEYQLSI